MGIINFKFRVIVIFRVFRVEGEEWYLREVFRDFNCIRNILFFFWKFKVIIVKMLGFDRVRYYVIFYVIFYVCFWNVFIILWGSIN